MNARRAKRGIVVGVVVVLCGLLALVLGADTWWIPTAIGLLNVALYCSNYANARKREHRTGA